METLTLTRLEQSVKKISDLIDLNLDNLNESFLVDNFKTHNNLKSTKLRKEFNQLCKNKAESKNMEEKTLSLESKKIYLCRENQVRDIPPILNPIFKNHKKLYLMGVPGTCSFIYSILNIMETDFLLKGPIQKEKSLDNFRNNIVYNLDDLYKKYNYKNKRFKKSVLRDNILSSKALLPQTINLIADYFNICLVIIDTETHLYSLGNDYRSDSRFVVMLRKNSYFQPILSTEGIHSFEENILEELEKILKPEIEIDKSPIKSDSDEDEEVEIPNELMKEKDYKIIVLQKIAEKLGISIFETGSKKKKLKKILYEEIKDKISSN
tara:strand:- start:149 stop:1117 length:969 start_codon:yes stop_codon:yes gene_type:complete